MKIRMYVDGASRGNPGPAGAGVLILGENGEILEEYKKYLGTATNNVAEYQALISGLDLAIKYQPCSLDVFLDSELLCNQMSGTYKVRNEVLIGHFRTAQQLLGGFEKVSFTHIPREQNKNADKLANQAVNIGSTLEKDICR